MPFSKNDLIRLSDKSLYKDGEFLYKHKCIRKAMYYRDAMTAEVRDIFSGKIYALEFSFNETKSVIKHCNCECFEIYEIDGICEHIVAAILQMQSLEAQDLEQKEKTSEKAAVQMLQTYVNRIADGAVNSRDGDTRFEPILEYDSSLNLSLFFRVGQQRMYIVQDLRMFCSRFASYQIASYGKFSLLHSLSSFLGECRPFVEFVLNRYNDYNYIYRKEVYGRFYNSGEKRSMFLSPPMTDEFFSMLEGKQLTIRDDTKNMHSVLVKNADFRPHIHIKKDTGGTLLYTTNWFALTSGDKRIYVLTDDTLYCCSEAFTEACSDLLNHLLDPKRSLFFSKHDTNILFSSVLKRIEQFVQLEIEGEFDEYIPVPLVTKIYLDSPDTGSVTCRMSFTYGERTIDAFGEKNAAESLDIAGEIYAEQLVIKYFGNKINRKNELFFENDLDALYRLIADGLDELSRIGEIYTTDSFGKITIRPPTAVSVGVRLDAGLLNLNFSLDGIDLSELPAILSSYRTTKKYHRLRDGSFLTLEDNALSGLSELAEGFDLNDKQLSSGHAELASNRALYLDAVCKRNEELYVNRDQSFKQILRDMNEVENADFPVPDSLRRILRNYQKTGFRWLKTVDAYGFGGILADDMGLGKTIQILALLQSYHDECGDRIPSIVLCPSSLSLNWESEANRFTPALRTSVIIGTAPERAELISKLSEYDLIITSYDLLKRDIEKYENLSFRFIIIDEAQYIKNQNTQNAKAVKALKGRTKLALTGTPVENNLAELWSIFDFLMPGYLFNYTRFRKKFEEPITKNGTKEVSARLKQLVKPFLLRRIKSEVLKELPPKTETVLMSSMNSKQQKLYVANLAQARADIAAQAGIAAGQDRIMILAALTRMRQICCDPSLIYDDYDEGSVKFEACMELIDRCMSSGHRILLFSQFTSMLDIIGTQLNKLSIEYFRIDGSTKPSSRLDLVNKFNNGNTPIFLISLKAGGTGLNLTGADVVIHYDPWWNLSAQNQATDRAHRIGQKNSVQVYKLIVKNTVEEHILKLQERKADLANTIIEENNDPLERLKREELLSLFDDASTA